MKFSSNSGKSRNKSPCTGAVSLFSFLLLVSVESSSWFPSGGLLVLRRCNVAGTDEESSVVSCGNDVREVTCSRTERTGC